LNYFSCSRPLSIFFPLLSLLTWYLIFLPRSGKHFRRLSVHLSVRVYQFLPLR
jgi:hypothetical protein